MGHQKSRNQSKTSNYPSGDNSGGQTYLSLLPRVISSGIIKLFNSDSFERIGASLAIFSAAFLIALLTSSSFAPVQNSDASTRISINTSGVSHFINISSAIESGGTGIASADIQTTMEGTRGIATDSLTVTSNVPQGYKIFVSMANTTYGQNLVYYNENGSVDDDYYLSPVSGSITSPGTLTTANTWGVAVPHSWNSVFSESGYTTATVSSTTKFAPVPAFGEEVQLFSTDSAKNENNPDHIDVYYGHYANSALPSGTYKNYVLYTAYAEATSGTGTVISYSGSVHYKNNELPEEDQKSFTLKTSLFTNRTIAPEQVSVKITDTDNTQKTCTVTDVSKATVDSVVVKCTAPGVTKPGDYPIDITISDYGFHATSTVSYGTPGITATVSGVETTITTMQGMTSDICTNWAPTPSASTINVPEAYLLDNRDNNMYRVRKLKDGNCWMTENLRLTFENGEALDSKGSGNTVALTSHNSDFTTQSSWDGGGHTSENASSHTIWFSFADSYNPNNIPKSYSSGQSQLTVDDSAQYIGSYYDWYVATAGKGIVSLDEGKSVEDSICPKGWRLPLGNSSATKSFSTLVTNLSVDQAKSAPYSLIPTGRYHHIGGYVTSLNTTGAWYTATAHNLGNDTYSLEVGKNTVELASFPDKGWGYAVRCVSR